MLRIKIRTACDRCMTWDEGINSTIIVLELGSKQNETRENVCNKVEKKKRWTIGFSLI